MPFISGKNAYLSACDIYGASFVISTEMNTITLARSKDNPNFKVFGASNVGRVVGIADTTLTGAFIWNSAEAGGSGVAAILEEAFSGSWVMPLKFAPAGSVSGCPLYSGCWLINALEINAPVDGVVSGTVGWENALTSGIVTGSCA
jgi:hypothetical protein